MLFADHTLARRLELAESLGAACCADAEAALRPTSGAASLSTSGGYAAFHGLNSPLTHAVGLGMNGPVTVADLEAVEEFFRSRGSAAVVHLCPLADPTLQELMAARAYRFSAFTNVLVRTLRYGEMIPTPAAGITTRPARADEADMWSRLMLHGFLGREAMSDTEYSVGNAIFHSSVAWVAQIGEDVQGGAALSVQEGLACFFADSTLPAARNRGIHTALIRARLRRALERGCDMATASATPGSISQHNYEMCGFRVAYTKAIFTSA
ncbi:MAG: GNAT family N-acetyltransferase [Bryobacteraceae bacterium]